MRIGKWIFAAAIAATLAVAGCAKQQGTVDTAPLENSFKTAEPATQSTANKAVTAIKSGDYTTAIGELKTLAGNAKLTPEQQQAIKDVTSQVEQAIAGAADKAKAQAGQAVEDVKKALPK